MSVNRLLLQLIKQTGYPKKPVPHPLNALPAWFLKSAQFDRNFVLSAVSAVKNLPDQDLSNSKIRNQRFANQRFENSCDQPQKRDTNCSRVPQNVTPVTLRHTAASVFVGLRHIVTEAANFPVCQSVALWSTACHKWNCRTSFGTVTTPRICGIRPLSPRRNTSVRVCSQELHSEQRRQLQPMETVWFDVSASTQNVETRVLRR